MEQTPRDVNRIERWKTESKANPADRLPEHLTETIIEGTPEESQKAYEELAQWSRTTNTPVLASEYIYLSDARGMSGYDAHHPPTLPTREPGPTFSQRVKRLIPKRFQGPPRT